MKKLKNKYLSSFLCLICCFLCLVGSVVITPLSLVYCDNAFVPPEGYFVYKSEALDNGYIKYYLLSTDLKEKNVGFDSTDDENTVFSFSPQMTYALYGVDSNETIDFNSAADLMQEIATSKNVQVEDLTQDMIANYIKETFDRSSQLSNSFAYSGISDDDSYVATCFDKDEGNFMNYVTYMVYDKAGLNDWYVSTQNILSWHNVYKSESFDSYDTDFCTFANYGGDGKDNNFIYRLYPKFDDYGNVVVRTNNLIKFQSLAQALFGSGMAIFDVYSAEINAKSTPTDILNALVGGTWHDIFKFSDYQKLHAHEDESIALGYLKSPVENITLANNNLIVDIWDDYSYKVGYYVDYLVAHNPAGGKYIIYRHYFYPEKGEYASGKIVLNGNSLETFLPFTTCNFSNTQDDTLIKGVGFFGYGLESGSTNTVAQFAPTRTVGLGDISFITAYDYYTFKYPFGDKEYKNYNVDWKGILGSQDCLVYIIDPSTGEVISTEDDVIDFEFDVPLNDVVSTDFNTYTVVSDDVLDGNTVHNVTNNYIQNQTTIINNNTNISDDDKTSIQTDLNKIKDTNNDDDNNVDENSKEYWSTWKAWITDMKEFIAGVPELLSELWSWLPEPLPKFIVASIATGFGICVIKVLLNRE